MPVSDLVCSTPFLSRCRYRLKRSSLSEEWLIPSREHGRNKVSLECQKERQEGSITKKKDFGTCQKDTGANMNCLLPAKPRQF